MSLYARSYGLQAGMAVIGSPTAMSLMPTAPLTTLSVVINCSSGDLTAGGEGRKYKVDDCEESVAGGGCYGGEPKLLRFSKQTLKVLLRDAANTFLVRRVTLSAVPAVVRGLSLEVGGERISVDVERESGPASLPSKLLGHAPTR